MLNEVRGVIFQEIFGELTLFRAPSTSPSLRIICIVTDLFFHLKYVWRNVPMKITRSARSWLKFFRSFTLLFLLHDCSTRGNMCEPSVLKTKQREHHALILCPPTWSLKEACHKSYCLRTISSTRGLASYSPNFFLLHISLALCVQPFCLKSSGKVYCLLHLRHTQIYRVFLDMLEGIS